ncbi:MAG: hypothetical protein AB7S78_07590 [Candidatus Omnitrophota bacterium]
MRFEEKKPPRRFTVGMDKQITISDCGDIYLNHNEQVTFKTQDGKEYDLAKKDWGYYATPSLNGRLEQFNLRGVLVKNMVSKRYFVLLVERGKEPEFEEYLKEEQLKIITWMDNSDVLNNLEQKLKQVNNG